jgi:hypothetical protein
VGVGGVALGGGYFVVVAVDEGRTRFMSLLRNWDDINGLQLVGAAVLLFENGCGIEKRVVLFFVMSVAA